MAFSLRYLTAFLLTVALISPKTIIAIAPQSPVINQALIQLNQYAQIQAQLNIQHPDIAYGMRKALIMAQLLLPSSGQLNLDLIPQIKQHFTTGFPGEYEINKLFEQLDSSWQPFFDQIKAPQDPTCVSNITLRALFGLPPAQPITDYHAKIAVLSAMLAPYNQGPVGNCFAVSIVLRDHNVFFKHAAKDYRAILKKGYLVRTVDQVTDQFFYLPQLADPDKHRPFILNASGTISNTPYTLLEAPGFLVARAVMGGDDRSCSLPNLMRLLNPTAQKQIQMTPFQVIRTMASLIAPGATPSNLDALTLHGAYAFGSLTNNPVLRAVESAFAGMAKVRSTDPTRASINNCIAQALNIPWKQVQTLPGAAKFAQNFLKLFNNSYRLIYNLDIPLSAVSADGSSTNGGFQLYKRDSKAPETVGAKVSTPQELRQLAIDVITTTAMATQTPEIGNALIAYANMDPFLKNALWAFDRANQTEPDPIRNYLKLARTPMQSCDGDDPFEVDDIETKTNDAVNVVSYIPKHATDLISWCLTLAMNTPLDMAPMASPQHAFNFMPKNPDLINFLNSKAAPSLWIHKTLVIPGMQVATRTIDSATQLKLSQAMWQLISKAFPNTSRYQQLITSLSKTKMNIQAYSQKLIDGINQLLGSSPAQAQRIAQAFDSTLLQCLSPLDQAILGQSAIKFAFTNWNEGLKDIYFCVYFNPRTGQISFGTILEDKTQLRSMDEAAWVNSQQWHVDLSNSVPMHLD